MTGVQTCALPISWNVKGTLVRPQDITTSALLTVEGELDDISGSGQTKAAHDLCTGVPADRRFHYDVQGAGHYGIFSGRRWRDMAYPQVRDFIRRYNPVTVTPDPAPRAAAEPQAAMAAPMQATAQATVAAPKRAPRKAAAKPVAAGPAAAAQAAAVKATPKAAAKPAAKPPRKAAAKTRQG